MPIEGQAPEISKLANDLAKEATGMTLTEAWERGICVDCKQPPKFYSESGRKEYQISAICEPCFDKMFEDIGDEDDEDDEAFGVPERGAVDQLIS